MSRLGGLILVAVVLFAAALASADSRNQVDSDFRVPQPLAPGSGLVLGVVGGWERWDQDNRGVGRTAVHLRRRLNGSPVWVETVENHKLELAERLLPRVFADPQRPVRLILYGQSLGGSAAVRLARFCARRGLPIDLLVLVDSYGLRDRRIPSNVRQAANLYQRDSFPIEGNPRIEAEDPVRTRILFNRRFHYAGRTIPMPGEPWIRRFWLRGHLKMEYDDEPWREVERLIGETVSRWR